MLRRTTKFLTILLVTCAACVVPVGSATASPTDRRDDAAIIVHWQQIAARTIFTENATPIPISSLYFGFVSTAVYNAVDAAENNWPGGDDGRGNKSGHRRASAAAAAATASYLVLDAYFPASAAALAADYEASLDGLSERGKQAGKRIGEDAAADLLEARRDDGIGAPIVLDVEPAPGVWQPTPPSLAPMLAPWLGFVRTLSLDAPIPLSGPDPIDSAAYAEDLAEVKGYGALNGSMRTADQTQTALFWNTNAVWQYQLTMADQVTRRGLDVLDSARAFALLGTATADTLISCWRAKYDFAFWRPLPRSNLPTLTATTPPRQTLRGNRWW